MCCLCMGISSSRVNTWMYRRDQAQGAEGSGALRSIGDSCAAIGKQIGECGHSFGGSGGPCWSWDWLPVWATIIYIYIHMFFPNNLRIGRIIQKSSKLNLEFTFDKCWISPNLQVIVQLVHRAMYNQDLNATLRCDAAYGSKSGTPWIVDRKFILKILKIPKTNYTLWFCYVLFRTLIFEPYPKWLQEWLFIDDSCLMMLLSNGW